MKRYDERDIMFARMTYEKGKQNYEDYYQRNPDKKALDDMLRNSPEICSPDTLTYDPIDANFAISNFKFLSDIRNLAEGKVSEKRIAVDPESITKKLKKSQISYRMPLFLV